MQKNISREEDLLLKSERWTPPRRGVSQLNPITDAIFNLRYIKGFSYNSIKKFLAENGIKTSTASLSSFCRSKFAMDALEGMKPEITARIADLRRNDAQSKDEPRS